MSPIAPGLVSTSVTGPSGTFKDLADFNFIVENWPDLLSGPLREYEEASRPGRIDTTELDSDPRYKPAEFQIIGTIYARTSSYAVASMLTDLRNLKGWCARSTALKVNCLDTAVYRACKLTAFTAQDIGIVGATPAMRVSMTFRAKDPLWYEVAETSNNLTTSLTQQALGSAPVRPIIRFTGAPTGLTLTYADSADATVKTLTLASLTTSGATYTEIDMGAMTIVQMISSVLTNAIDKLNTNDGSDFFALRPEESDTVTPTWCKVKYALAGGSVSGVTCKYHKAHF